jgi:sRNA-binding protein
MPAEAALVRNLLRDDYVATVCGSLDDLPKAFAELDRQERQNRMNAQTRQDKDRQDEENLGAVLQIASASLSSADRRVVRTEKMDRRIEAAAGSRAPRRRC